ncbi:MAG: hypothetical protein KKA07_11360 [Bacteroidetes bacterium]|nr:hypothetical protein [Bacteroidota bacterium]MBU1719657.1 hypothetical protein [Bacteroidota bacterium]
MNRWLLSILIFWTALAAAQDDPPAAVKKTFSKLFNHANNTEYWEADGFFEVNFSIDGTQKIARISESGEWIETLTYLGEKISDANLDKAAKLHCPGSSIKTVTMIEKPGPAVFYDITAETDEKACKIRLSADGTLVSSQQYTIEETDEE